LTSTILKKVSKMTAKPARRPEFREVLYNSDRWILLQQLRNKATKIMKPLDESYLENLVHGSIARGDVSRKSDIDIFITSDQSSFSVETALEKAGISVNKRFVVQATPTYAMKAHIEIDEGTTVSFPLMKMRKVEKEFYRFGGEANLEQLEKDTRVLGVDKRLMLIEPTEEGHLESTVSGREEQVAKMLGVSTETVSDRVHALIRRDEIGRTGVFIKEELADEETFEMALKRLAAKNPAVRRRLTSLS
jgi:predicted nucleotidyltransferase